MNPRATSVADAAASAHQSLMRPAIKALVVLQLLAANPVVAVAQTARAPLTTREMEALRPSDANKAVQHDLLSVLTPVRKIDSGMFRRLQGVGLHTQSFGTEFRNVCRRDQLTLWYAPTNDDRKPEDTPVQPYSIDSSPVLHIVGKPRPERAAAERDSLVFEPACRDLDDNDGWFAADTAFQALQGTLVLQQMLGAVQSGQLKSNPCPKISDPKASTCEQAIVASADPSKIDSIATCPAGAGLVCYVIDLQSSTELTIVARGNDSEVAPSEILSVAIEQYIVVT